MTLLAQLGFRVVFGSGTHKVRDFLELCFEVVKLGGDCISISNGSIKF